MKDFLKIVVIFILLLNGTGALYGGLHLIMHPDGSSLQMPLTYLAHSPFENYLIPGIVLFTANGLLSLIVLIAWIARFKNTTLLVMLQGLILCGWILIQVIMIRTISSLHIIFLLAGMILLVLGWWLRYGFNKPNTKHIRQL